MYNNGSAKSGYTLRLTWLVCLMLVGAALQADVGRTCTIAVATDGETILAANNEDYADPRTALWFIPAANGAFGRVLWGYDRYSFPHQGGMNERGLFIDLNAIPGTGWTNSPDKPDFTEDVYDHVLSHFATLAEVIRFFETYDVDLGWVKYFVADAEGNSAIFEWLDGQLNVVLGEGPYQISTNYQSPLEPTEPRYQIAEKILAQPGRPSVTRMRRVLSATAYDVNELGQTLYSTICDLKRKTINVYHFHNFEEVVTFDLLEELDKGGTEYRIPELFEIRPHYEYWFNISGIEIGVSDLADHIEKHGLDGARERFHQMREDTRTYNKYIFDEWAMHGLAMTYQKDGRSPEALAILELAAEAFPNSSWSHRNLAEAHMANGDAASAIAAYERALELDPENARVRAALDDLKSELLE